MKIKQFLVIITALSISIISCKKDNGSKNPSSSNAHPVRIQQGIDADLTNDTVYLISYDDSNRIVKISDSINQDDLIANYNVSGRLSSVTETYGTNASYHYDENGLLEQIDYQSGGSHEQFVFEYTNGTVSKKTYNSNLGSGPVSLMGYFTYTVTGGNITDIKEYSSGGNLVRETTCSYGAQANPFKSLSLFNYGNILGTDDIINLETYFNKNNLIGFSISGTAASSAYTFNSAQQTTKIITTDNITGNIYSWTFFY